MHTRAMMLGLSALALAGSLVSAGNGGAAFASARDAGRDERQAMESARKAQSLLAAGNADAAVVHAEKAVSLRPDVADYRVVLGQAYLKVGRFASARDAFGDVLKLTPDNGKAALNLSLAQIATGDWEGARKTLAGHADMIGASDRGLAIALAGDPERAVELLTEAVRTPGADAKTRQNLALALALAGRWTDAKTMVAYDVAPDQVDARIAQWAAFARPHAAYDQVASLLGVHAVEDQGQPVALALVAPAAKAPTVAQAEPVKTVPQAEVAPAKVETPTPVTVPASAPAVAAVAPVAAPVPAIQFAPRAEVVQKLPLVMVQAPAAKPSQVAVPYKPGFKPVARSWPIAAKPAAKGSFYVQIGAFSNAGVAKDAWRRAQRHFAGQMPQGMTFTAANGTFYRLSVGGFSRHDAVTTCIAYRAKGGKCFVRAGAGDQLASWVKPDAPKFAQRSKPDGVKLAAR